jgi:ubiquinone/menaquinone biosynthesis C-methylase UbiE
MIETEFWDGIAEKYAKSPIKDTAAYEYTFERTQSYLGAEDAVLELGCGTGSTALRLAGSAGRIVASDISDGMLEVGRRNAAAQGVENVEFLQGDVFAPALDGQLFDVVMVFNTLHLVRDLDAVLARCHGLLKPGGLLISKTPCLGDVGLLKRAMFRAVIPVLQLFRRAPFVSLLTSARLETGLSGVGFDIVERVTLPSDPSRPYIVARRD